MGNSKSSANSITRRYGPSTNRDWWGATHRRWLLDSGRYVRSGERRSIRAGMPLGLRVVGEDGPELVGLHAGTLRWQLWRPNAQVGADRSEFPAKETSAPRVASTPNPRRTR